MKKSCAVVVCAGLLSGCALPVPITIATLMADGFTMATSEKTVLEHSLSAVTGQDCAILAGVVDGEICSNEQGVILVADRADVGEWTTAEAPLSTSELQAYSEASLIWGQEVSGDTLVAASSDDHSELVHHNNPLSADTDLEPTPITTTEIVQVAASSNGVKDKAPKNVRIDDLFYVIGSFYTQDRAIVHAEKYPAIDSQVFQLKLGDRMVYRVAVGPFSREDRKQVWRDIRRAGIREPWAIRPDGVGETVVARPNNPLQVAERTEPK